MGKKLFIMMLHGPEDPELATIPFVMATAAQASGIDVKIGFQGRAIVLAKKGCVEHVFAANFPPLKELIDTYVEAGGEIFLCGPCVISRQLKEEDFISNAKIVNAPTFVNEVMSSDQVLVY